MFWGLVIWIDQYSILSLQPLLKFTISSITSERAATVDSNHKCNYKQTVSTDRLKSLLHKLENWQFQKCPISKFVQKVKLQKKIMMIKWVGNRLFCWSNEFMNDAFVVEPNWVVKYKLKFLGWKNKVENNKINKKNFLEVNIMFKLKMWGTTTGTDIFLSLHTHYLLWTTSLDHTLP